MAVKLKTNKTKKRQRQSPAKAGVRTRRKPIAKKAVSSAPASTILKAEDLGISTDYLVGRAMTETASMVAPATVPENLPVVDFPVDSEVKVYTPLSIHRPLVGHRTSFWIGVGFGVFVVGVLAILTWQLTRVSVVEAVVSGLTGL